MVSMRQWPAVRMWDWLMMVPPHLNPPLDFGLTTNRPAWKERWWWDRNCMPNNLMMCFASLPIYPDGRPTVFSATETSTVGTRPVTPIRYPALWTPGLGIRSSVFWAICSCLWVKERFAQKKLAKEPWATWANHSRLLFCKERWDRIAQVTF